MLKERDYQNGQLRIPRAKNGIVKFHDLSDNQKSLLSKWFKIRKMHGADTPIFISREGGPISTKQLDTLMRKYAEKAKLPKDHWHFHTLRHSCAVHMVQKDIPIVKIKDWLGHRDIHSTMVYADVNPQAMSDTATSWYKDEKKIKIDWSKDKK